MSNRTVTCPYTKADVVIGESQQRRPETLVYLDAWDDDHFIHPAFGDKSEMDVYAALESFLYGYDNPTAIEATVVEIDGAPDLDAEESQDQITLRQAIFSPSPIEFAQQVLANFANPPLKIEVTMRLRNAKRPFLAR